MPTGQYIEVADLGTVVVADVVLEVEFVPVAEVLPMFRQWL